MVRSAAPIVRAPPPPPAAHPSASPTNLQQGGASKGFGFRTLCLGFRVLGVRCLRCWGVFGLGSFHTSKACEKGLPKGFHNGNQTIRVSPRMPRRFFFTRVALKELSRGSEGFLQRSFKRVHCYQGFCKGLYRLFVFRGSYGPRV